MGKKLSVFLSYLLCFAMLLTPLSVTGFADELSLSEEEGYTIPDEETLTEEFLPGESSFEEKLTEEPAEILEDEVLPEDPQETAAENTEESEFIASLPEDVPYLKLAKPHIMYGEDGSNKNGNLDEIFSPVYILNKTEYKNIPVSYLFTTDLALKDTVTPESFDTLTGIKLEDQKAGTEVLAIVKASPADAEPTVSAVVFTIEKRKIRIVLPKNSGLEVTEKELPEEGTVTVTAGDEIYGNLVPEYIENASFDTAEEESETVSEVISEEELGIAEVAATDTETKIRATDMTEKPAEEAALEVKEEASSDGSGITVASESFVQKEELAAFSDSILYGDIVYDVSGIDGDAPGYQQVPVHVSITPELEENYEFEEALGYVYVGESEYWITFEAINNGQVKTQYFKNTLIDGATQDLATFVAAILAQIDVLNGGHKLTGWAVSTNGGKTSYLDTGFHYFGTTTSFVIKPRQDYYLRAIQGKNITDGLVVDTISSVYYDGRSHVIQETTLKSSALKSKVNDLFLTVSYLKPDGNLVLLRYGTDYTVSYKNNKNASLKMKDDGTYEKAYTSDAQRPYVIVTGKGNFKGFKTTVYFDILPYNFGYVSSLANGPLATISGLKYSYALKNGKLSGTVKPVVKIKFSKTFTLKKGTDYTPVIYKAVSDKWVKQAITDPSEITTEGAYLYTVQGINNYCGTVFGQTGSQISFNDGTKPGDVTPAICSYSTGACMECQFIVKDNTKLDLANAKVTVGTKSKPYKNGTFYTGENFKIKVKAGTAELKEGIDYRIIYDGVDYKRFVGYNKLYQSYISEMSSSEFADKIQMANTYKIRIVAVDGNTAGYFGSQSSKKTVKISGTKIESKWFKLTSKKISYDGNASSGTFKYDLGMKVTRQTPNILPVAESTTEYTLYDYGTNFEKYYALGSSYANAVTVMSEFDVLPGTYTMAVYPLGPGVNHDKMLTVKYKRTAITMDKAIEKGLVKVTAAENAKYNAGGSLPSKINILYNGRWTNNLGLRYNGESFTVYDKYGYPTTIKVYGANNTKPGKTPYFVLQGDGTVFKGKSKSKKLTYAVDPTPVTSDTDIAVIDASNFDLTYGSYTTSLPYPAYDPGRVYAVLTPIEKTDKNMDGSLPKKSKVKITLYQTCFKNEAEYNEKRMSLAKIDPKQYDFTLKGIEGEDHAFLVTVTNKAGMLPAETGFDFGTGKTLLADYTVYDKAAKITSVTVKKGSETYTLPADSSKPITFTGGAIKFDELVSATLNNGETVDGNSLRAEYKKNVATGKGTITVYLKRETTGYTYKYGGSGKFTFTIQKAADGTF